MSPQDIDVKYHVKTDGLSTSDYEELRDKVHPKGSLTGALCGSGSSNLYYDFHIQAQYLLPIAGALGKTVLDVITDRVKDWLANRPEDRTVKIYGPGETVVSVVKVGKNVTTKVKP